MALSPPSVTFCPLTFPPWIFTLIVGAAAPPSETAPRICTLTSPASDVTSFAILMLPGDESDTPVFPDTVPFTVKAFAPALPAEISTFPSAATAAPTVTLSEEAMETLFAVRAVVVIASVARAETFAFDVSVDPVRVP